MEMTISDTKNEVFLTFLSPPVRKLYKSATELKIDCLSADEIEKYVDLKDLTFMEDNITLVLHEFLIHTTSDENIPFVHTFNSANPQVLDIIRQSTSLLTPSERMMSVMNSRKIIAARRQPPNLRSLLFHPRFEGLDHSAPGS